MEATLLPQKTKTMKTDALNHLTLLEPTGIPKPVSFVKVLGQLVRAGSKKHAVLLAQKKHFDDLANH